MWSYPTQGYSEELSYDGVGRVVRVQRKIHTRTPQDEPSEVDPGAVLTAGDGRLRLVELTHHEDVERRQTTRTLVETPQTHAFFSFTKKPTLTEVETSYDARGHVVQVIGADGIQDFTIVENGAGQVTKSTWSNPLSGETGETVYNDDGSTTTTYTGSGTSSTETQYFDARGQVTKIVTGTSETQLKYDGPFVRESIVIDDGYLATTSYTRSDSGRAAVQTNTITSNGGANPIRHDRYEDTRVGRVGEFRFVGLTVERSGYTEYDGAGHLLRRRTRFVNGGSVNTTRQMFYDLAGTLVGEVTPEVEHVESQWEFGSCADTDCPAILVNDDGSVTLRGHLPSGSTFKTRSIAIPAGLVELPSSPTSPCHFDGTGAEQLYEAIGYYESGNIIPIIELFAATTIAESSRCDLRMMVSLSQQTDSRLRQAEAAYSIVDDASAVTGLAGLGGKLAFRGGRYVLGRGVAALERRAAKAAGGTLATLTQKAIGDVCPGPNCPCFVAGTLVQTPTGPVAIEELEAGDVVVSWDEETNEWQEQPIARTFVTPDKALMTVALFDDASVVEAITATPTHPWYVEDAGWVATRDLEPGDLVPSSSAWRDT
jgi:hypothetical protein